MYSFPVHSFRAQFHRLFYWICGSHVDVSPFSIPHRSMSSTKDYRTEQRLTLELALWQHRPSRPRLDELAAEEPTTTRRRLSLDEARGMAR